MTIVEYQAFQLLEFHFHAKKLETKHASTPPSPSPSPPITLFHSTSNCCNFIKILTWFTCVNHFWAHFEAVLAQKLQNKQDFSQESR